MSLTIPDEIIRSTKMSISELAQEIAIMLYQKNKLTLSQASHLADMSILRFQHLLASRQIPINFDEDDLNQDLKALEELGRL